MQAGIVGMGVMGRVLAFNLRQAGWQVTLFDQHSGDNNCSLAASGLLSPASELDKADPLIFYLGQDALQTGWPTILTSLSKPIYFQKNGTIVIHHPQDQAEWKLFNRRMANKIDNTAECQELDTSSLLALEPALEKFQNAYYFKNEAHVDCHSLMAALSTYLETHNVVFLRHTKVISLAARQIVTEAATHTFHQVFDCRGLAARNVFADLRAVRGELLWLHAPEVSLQRAIRLLHPRYSVYLVPRPNNIYLLGASEIEAEDYSAISLRTTMELLSAAYSIHAGFAEARIIKTVSHCRPVLANHLPRIVFRDGVVAINGLYRYGYLIAPALAAEVIRRLKNTTDVCYRDIWET